MGTTPPRNSLFFFSSQFSVLRLPFRNDYPHGPAVFTETAVVLPQRFSRSVTFQAGCDQVEFLKRRVRELGRILKSFGMMVVAQPEDQLAFEVFALLAGKLRAALRPPLANVAV